MIFLYLEYLLSIQSTCYHHLNYLHRNRFPGYYCYLCAENCYEDYDSWWNEEDDHKTSLQTMNEKVQEMPHTDSLEPVEDPADEESEQ